MIHYSLLIIYLVVSYLNPLDYVNYITLKFSPFNSLGSTHSFWLSLSRFPVWGSWSIYLSLKTLSFMLVIGLASVSWMRNSFSF